MPDLDEWACAVCGPGRSRLGRLIALLAARLGRSIEVDSAGDELEDAEFDADELGLTEDDDPEI